MDPWVGAPKPGLYEGVAFETYRLWPAANHAVLKHFAQSAAHAEYAMKNPDKETAAKRQGHTTHVAILEPDRFLRDYVAAPKLDMRFNTSKAAFKEFCEIHAGKTVVAEDEYQAAGRMSASVWAHPTAAALLRGGVSEVSLCWRDRDLGVPCKGRIDHMGELAEWPVIVDVKTAADASRRAFEKAVHSFGYHHQAAMYLDGAEALGMTDRRYAFVVVENEPPHCVAVYELDPEAISLGRDDYKAHLQQYVECMTRGTWPGYPDGMDVVSVPAWALREVTA